jgi:hypothetical protein
MIYRRHRHSETWHVSELCHQWPVGPSWPAGDYEELDTRPRFGHICTQCLRLMSHSRQGKERPGSGIRPE